MPVTITAGVTFSGGGLTMAFAPSVPTAGWFSGGFYPAYFSTVQRITFATDTATASVRGPLTATLYRHSGVGTNAYGWHGGGMVWPTPVSTITRITYATDTATSTNRGPLNTARYYLSGTGNDNYGWNGPGENNIAPYYSSIVDRITYASDTTTASSRGKLSTSKRQYGATGNTNYGWFAGGTDLGSPSQPIISTIDRIDYANDTAIATSKGPLSSNRNGMGASTDSIYGWFAGGYLYPGAAPYAKSIVDRIDYSNDTATASVRGPLNTTKQDTLGVGDTTYGWFAMSNNYSSSVSRITYATDTATGVARGILSNTARLGASSSGIQ